MGPAPDGRRVRICGHLYDSPTSGHKVFLHVQNALTPSQDPPQIPYHDSLSCEIGIPSSKLGPGADEAHGVRFLECGSSQMEDP